MFIVFRTIIFLFVIGMLWVFAYEENMVLAGLIVGLSVSSLSNEIAKALWSEDDE